MNRLIGDLVDVASIDAGKLAVTPATRDLAIVIGEAADSFRATASAKGVSLEAQIDAAPLLAAFDHQRILQVLANLISNSLKFTPRGGKITVRGEREAGNVRLCVRDTGPGIPDDALERIFERFAQVGKDDRRAWVSACTYPDASSKPMGDGSGRRAGPAQAARCASRSPRTLNGPSLPPALALSK